MELYKSSFFGILALFVMFVSCEPSPQSPEDYADNDNFTVKLSAEKAAGKGQYYRKVESGNPVTVNITVNSSSPVNEFSITKTSNVKVDSTFGANGMITVDVSGLNFEYQFNYTPKVSDIENLVGFTFTAVNADDETEQSDLKLNVTLSPRDNFTRVEWDLTSILHVNEENKETIEGCNDGYSLLFNPDSTMTKNYGEQACGLDGLRAYEEWYFSENETQLIMISHNVFTPDIPINETFEVKTLTTEELALEQTIDLSDLGEGIETFLYIYNATPR